MKESLWQNTSVWSLTVSETSSFLSLVFPVVTCVSTCRVQRRLQWDNAHTMAQGWAASIDLTVLRIMCRSVIKQCRVNQWRGSWADSRGDTVRSCVWHTPWLMCQGEKELVCTLTSSTHSGLSGRIFQEGTNFSAASVQHTTLWFLSQHPPLEILVINVYSYLPAAYISLREGEPREGRVFSISQAHCCLSSPTASRRCLHTEDTW